MIFRPFSSRSCITSVLHPTRFSTALCHSFASPMYISSPAQLPYTPHVLYFMFIVTPHLIVYMHKTPFHETLLLHLLLQPKRDVVRFFDIHIPRKYNFQLHQKIRSKMISPDDIQLQLRVMLPGQVADVFQGLRRGGETDDFGRVVHAYVQPVVKNEAGDDDRADGVDEPGFGVIMGHC